MNLSKKLAVGFICMITMLVAIPLQASAAEWGAAYVGVASGAVHPGVSYGQNSMDGAKRRALSACQNSSVGSYCKFVGAWNGPKGCGFVSYGSRGKAAGFGIGPTPAAARASCTKYSNGVYKCGRPVGGCNGGM